MFCNSLDLRSAFPLRYVCSASQNPAYFEIDNTEASRMAPITGLAIEIWTVDGVSNDYYLLLLLLLLFFFFCTLFVFFFPLLLFICNVRCFFVVVFVVFTAPLCLLRCGVSSAKVVLGCVCGCSCCAFPLSSWHFFRALSPSVITTSMSYSPPGSNLAGGLSIVSRALTHLFLRVSKKLFL